MEKQLLLLAAKLLEDYAEEVSYQSCSDASREVMKLVGNVGVDEFMTLAVEAGVTDREDRELPYSVGSICRTVLYKLREMTKTPKTIQKYPSFYMSELCTATATFSIEDIEFLKKEFIGKQYKHYNGNIYTVLHLTNTSTLSGKHPIDVVYMGQNGNVWSRPLSDWFRSFTKVEYLEQA